MFFSKRIGTFDVVISHIVGVVDSRAHNNKYNMRTITTTSAIAAVTICSTAVGAFQNGRTIQYKINRIITLTPSSLSMKSTKTIDNIDDRVSSRKSRSKSIQQQKQYDRRKGQITSLSIATLSDAEKYSVMDDSIIPQLDNLPNIASITKVLSASLLVTGNTVGPSMFVLPEAVGGVGFSQGTAIFIGMYLYNLISGLLLADVAINLHECSDCEVPSSFKDFVDEALKSKTAGNLMAAASLVSNSCFLAFGVVHAGSLLANTFPSLGVDPTLGGAAFAATLAMFSITQTNSGLERIANACVMVLFSSFSVLLLPSLANVVDPIGTLTAQPSNPDGLSALAAACPLLLSSLSYQNIVPSITKLLDFDRTKSTIAIALGSFLPMAMYLLWSFAALGGGVESSTASSSAGALAFDVFTASALVGSCIPSVMCLAEETESIFSSMNDDEDNCPVKTKYSPISVAAPMIPSVAIGLAFSKGGDLTEALHFNGAFITPLLFGLLPVILYQSVHKNDDTTANNSIFGNLPQVLVGAGTLGCLGQEIIQDVTAVLPNLVV